MIRLIPFFIFLISFLFTSCKEDSNPILPDTELVFRDNIPFSLLSKGIICFNRTSADLKSSGVCVIDINNHKTKAISGYFYQPIISPNGAKIAYSGMGQNPKMFQKWLAVKNIQAGQVTVIIYFT